MALHPTQVSLIATMEREMTILETVKEILFSIPKGFGQSLGTALGLLILGYIGLKFARWRDRKTQSQRDVIHVSLTMFQRAAEGINLLIRPAQTMPLEAMFVQKSLVDAVKQAAAGRKDRALLKDLFARAAEAIKGAPDADVKAQRLAQIKEILKVDVETILIPDSYERAVALNAAINVTNTLFEDGLTAQFAGLPVREDACILALTAEQTVEHRMPRVMLFRREDIDAIVPMVESGAWKEAINLAQPHHADRLTTMLKIAVLNELEEMAEVEQQGRHVRRYTATVRG